MPSTCFDNTSALQRNRLWLWLTLAIGVVVLPVARGRAAVWVGPTDGNQDWGAFGNWDNNDVPASPGETATINDTLTGNRVISVPAASINTLTWTSDPATFTDTLLLNGDLTVSSSFTFANAGTAAQKVIDLNNKIFSLASFSTGFPNGGDLTLRSSTPGGVIIIRRPNGGSMQVESGVTVQINSGLNQDWSTTTFQDGSTYRSNTISGEITDDAATGFYNFEVTASGSPTLRAGALTVRNDLTIADGGGVQWRNADRQVRVHGNFTDLETGHIDYGYFDASSSGIFQFVGGSTTQRTLTVHRTGITKTSFHVGLNSTTTGNVRLGADLSTQANFTVRENSLFDVAHFTVTAGTVTVEDGVTLTYTAGTDTGLIVSTGNLSLNSFTLNIVRDGKWDYLHDLVLFTYEGMLTGTPVLNLGDVPAGFVYGQLLTDGGVVRLTNVGLPEPGTLAIVGLGAVGLARRRWRNR